MKSKPALFMLLCFLGACSENSTEPAARTDAAKTPVADAASRASTTVSAAATAAVTSNSPATAAKSSDGMPCDSGDQSQAGLNECASNSARDADAELNRVYQQILSANKEDKLFIEKFKAAQRVWLAFRDAHIDARFPDDGGTVTPMCASGELESITRDRITQLRQWVDGTEEGDVCSGSYPIKDSQ